jgi:hypothetical protein
MAAIGLGNTRFTIMTPSSYKIPFASQWAFPCVILLVVLIMPESPWYQVRRGNEDAARASLRRILGDKPDSISRFMEVIKSTVEQELQLSSLQRSVRYSDCFKGQNFRRTRISCGMFFIQQAAGVAFYAQALYFLGILGLDTGLTFKLALAGFGVALVGNMLSWVLMSFVGMLLIPFCLMTTPNLLSVPRTNHPLSHRKTNPPVNWPNPQRRPTHRRRRRRLLFHAISPLLRRVRHEFCTGHPRANTRRRLLECLSRNQLGRDARAHAESRDCFQCSHQLVIEFCYAVFD